MNDELLAAHIIMGISTIMPAVLSKAMISDEPNKFIGYRTKWSLKSNETWKFANQKMGNLMIIASLVTITVQVFTYFVIGTETALIITVIVMLISLAVVFIIIEHGLRKNFNKDGSPKTSLR